MAITAAQVKALRESTGAGMMDCKRALTETNGDAEAARNLLRLKGAAAAEKKAGRAAAEGVIAVAEDSGAVAIAEVNCETDFVARRRDFREYAACVARTVLDEAPEDLNALLALQVDGQSLEQTRHGRGGADRREHQRAPFSAHGATGRCIHLRPQRTDRRGGGHGGRRP